MEPFEQFRTRIQQKIASQHGLQTSYDVIVLGVGSMGSAACYHLAKKGHRVLGLEQFDIPHEEGSHAGQTRIIRKAYFEHPNYVPLLHRAYTNWKLLEEACSTQLYFPTGLLYFGPADHELITGTLASAEQYNIEVNPLSEGQENPYPQFNVPSGCKRLIEPDAGFVIPERAILAHVDQALQCGAVIRTREKILDWSSQNGSIEVRTNHQIYTCDKLVICAGAWTSQLTPLSELEVTRQVIAWATPKDREPFELGNLPCWTLGDPAVSGIYYGFPILPAHAAGGPAGLKFAHHTKGSLSDPDSVDRRATKEETERLIATIGEFMPEAIDSIQTLKTCLYTYSPDDHFIIDFHPNNADVIIAAGFSGHGFKFASVIGEVLSELALDGRTSHPIDFLTRKRLD